MTSLGAAQTAPAPAPWRTPFLEHVAHMPRATFVLSTLHPVPAPEQVAASIPVAPRARTVIFRGMWATLPDNEMNAAPRNPRLYESDLPVLTTDARMDKAAEIVDTAATPGGALSAGGGPVEAVFWAEGASTQWRLRGTAWLLGPDIDSDAARAVREALLPRMRSISGIGVAEADRERSWSWSREITGHFGNLSPAMRGTFRHPPPGTPASIPPEKGLGLGQKVHDLNDEVARSNFRVVVILPAEVDRVDLSDPERPRRWLYSHKQGEPPRGAAARWETVELWP